MKRSAICLLALILLLCFSDISLAHRVNAFAYVDGDSIRVECSFSQSRKVMHGKLVIKDLETGAALLEGITDKAGVFRFRPDAAFLATGHGLNILLFAGEGHRAEWRVSPEELASLSQNGPKNMAQDMAQDGTQNGAKDAVPARRPAPVPATGPASDPAATASPMGSAAVASTVDAAELEVIVGRVLDAKLAPVKQALARQQDSGPDLRDIVGGLGWILGLLGLGAYMKYRR